MRQSYSTHSEFISYQRRTLFLWRTHITIKSKLWTPSGTRPTLGLEVPTQPILAWRMERQARQLSMSLKALVPSTTRRDKTLKFTFAIQIITVFAGVSTTKALCTHLSSKECHQRKKNFLIQKHPLEIPQLKGLAQRRRATKILTSSVRVACALWSSDMTI